MTDKSQWIHVDLGFKVHPSLQKAMAGRPRVQRIREWLEPGRKIVKCKRCKEPGHMEKTCKVPDPKYVAVDDDIPIDEPDPSLSIKKRKKDDEAAATADGDASDDEILINLIRKRARTTPQNPSVATQEKAKNKTPVKAKEKTPVKAKEKTPVKAKKKTPVKNAATKEKAKKKTPAKKSTSTGKKTNKNVPFAPVIPPPPSPPALQPAYGAKRSLFYWLGG